MGYASMGDVAVVGGFAFPMASGATGQQKVDVASVLGDWASDPLVKYMTAVRPGSLNGPVSQQFLDNVKYSLTEMQYQGQPLLTVEKSALAAAAAMAANFVAPLASSGIDTSNLQLMTAQEAYQKLIPIAQAVSNMPPVKGTPKFNLTGLGPMLACMKAKGTWNIKTQTCGMPRAGTPAQPLPPTAAPAPSADYTPYYIGGGVVVLGTIIYLATRKKAA
jgi:hypothetical protein